MTLRDVLAAIPISVMSFTGCRGEKPEPQPTRVEASAPDVVEALDPDAPWIELKVLVAEPPATWEALVSRLPPGKDKTRVVRFYDAGEALVRVGLVARSRADDEGEVTLKVRGATVAAIAERVGADTFATRKKCEQDVRLIEAAHGLEAADSERPYACSFEGVAERNAIEEARDDAAIREVLSTVPLASLARDLPPVSLVVIGSARSRERGTAIRCAQGEKKSNVTVDFWIPSDAALDRRLLEVSCKVPAASRREGIEVLRTFLAERDLKAGTSGASKTEVAYGWSPPPPTP